MKTFKELSEIDLMMGELYTKTPTLKDTKFGYGYKRFAEKNYYPKQKEYSEAVLDLRIENALVDEKTKAIIYRDNGQSFEYSKEGLKNLQTQTRKLENEWDVKEIEIEPYFIKEENLPKLNEYQTELLKGVLIE